ncbi:MAG: hypothetical protein AAGH88_14895 [Planctomycetota bacterium]
MAKDYVEAMRMPGKKQDADARRCLGRSRGGLTTRRYAAVDERGRLCRLIVTAGRRGDAPRAEGLLEGMKATTSWPKRPTTATTSARRFGR